MGCAVVLETVRALWAGSMALSLLVGCGDAPAASDAGGCLAPLDTACQPAYPATFRNLFDNELGATCGSAATGGSCHSAEGAQGGLVMEDFDTAYDHLLGSADGRARVEPGDPECSLLMQRIESTDTQFRMPPGTSALPDNVRCAFQHWIAEGAVK
jgi:hypothetical protein